MLGWVINYAMVCISGLGFFANFKSYRYITKTFNTSDNLFNVLAKDALINAALNALYSIGSIIMIINRQVFKSNKFACAFWAMTGFIPIVTGPFTSFLISLRRLIGLKYPNLASRNSRFVNLVHTVSLCLVMFYTIVMIFVTTFLDLGASEFINLCLGIPEGNGQYNYIVIVGLILPICMVIGLTITLDFANKTTIEHMIVEVSLSMRQAMEEKRGHNEIARRAIYINICLFIPWVFYSAIVGNSFDFSSETKTILITISNLFVDAIRNPIIARFAFRVNETIKRNTVEDRRQDEIKAALQKRQEIREENARREVPTVSRLVNSSAMPDIEIT